MPPSAPSASAPKAKSRVQRVEQHPTGRFTSVPNPFHTAESTRFLSNGAKFATIVCLVNRILLWSVVGGVAAVLVLFGYRAFPPPTVDSIHYLLPSVAWAGHMGLINPVSPLSSLDPTGQSRFVYYPPLFPLFIGSLCSPATGPQVLRVVSWVNVLTLLMSFWIFMKCSLRSSQVLSRYAMCLIAACLLGMGTLFTYHYGGRPEILATLLINSGIILGIGTRGLLRTVLWGGILGALGATQPIAAAETGMLLGVFFSGQYRCRSAIGYFIICGGVALLMFFGILLASPNGVKATLEGTLAHAALVREAVGFGSWRYLSSVGRP